MQNVAELNSSSEGRYIHTTVNTFWLDYVVKQTRLTCTETVAAHAGAQGLVESGCAGLNDVETCRHSLDRVLEFCSS